MSAFNGTPGPWRLESPNEGGRVLAMDDRETIVHSPPVNPFNEQVMADARLIAAAPELLEELMRANDQMEMAADCIEAGRYDEALLHVCSLSRGRRDAIAKATGEQP